jgi:hypothetical protein
MPTANTTTCPNCLERALTHTACPHPGCRFAVTSCPACDRAQAVAAFVADHAKDCVCGPPAPPAARHTFSAPRRAA